MGSTRQKSIVVIMAHADDIELSAGGTLAKYIADGYKALYGVLSRCNSGWTVTEEKGGHYISSLEIIPQRRAEAEAAAKAFGAELYFGGLLENCYTRRDGTLITPSFTGAGEPNRPFDDDVPKGTPLLVACGTGGWKDFPEVLEMADLLVKWEPELVIGQPFQNENPDHFAAALIMAKAWRIASKKVEIGPYWIPVIGVERQPCFPPLIPDRFVDITGHEEKCLVALACHKCQGGHLPSCESMVKKNWKMWGEKHGCTSAEAFIEVFPGKKEERKKRDG